jgi:hypothetical protein
VGYVCYPLTQLLTHRHATTRHRIRPWSRMPCDRSCLDYLSTSAPLTNGEVLCLVRVLRDERRLLARGKADGVATEIVDGVVLPEEGLRGSAWLATHVACGIASLTSPTIQRGPIGAGMSMPVKEEMQVPPALRM